MSPTTHTDVPQLLTEAEAANLLQWSKRTLQRRRWARLPPAYIKIGRSVRYDAANVEAFINEGRRTPPSRRGAA